MKRTIELCLEYVELLREALDCYVEWCGLTAKSNVEMLLLALMPSLPMLLGSFLFPLVTKILVSLAMLPVFVLIAFFAWRYVRNWFLVYRKNGQESI